MATFTADEGLPLKVGGTSRDGYLYVDYYRADGSVLHMLSGPGVSYRRLLALRQIDLVKAAAPGKRAISPPYGVGLFVAVTTREPMVRAPRDHEVEQTDAHLRTLEHLLKDTAARWGKDSIAASLAVITMQPPGRL